VRESPTHAFPWAETNLGAPPRLRLRVGGEQTARDDGEVSRWPPSP